MKGYMKITAALAAFALLLVVTGLSTQGAVNAQTVSSVTVAQKFLCSGGTGCEVTTDDGADEIDGATGDNLLSITFANAGTITLKSGGRSKVFGGNNGTPDDVDDDPPSLDSTPLIIAVVDETADGDYEFQAFSGNTITIEHTPADGADPERFSTPPSVTVDNFAPSIIAHSPSNPHITKTTGGVGLTFSATITDSLAGFAGNAATSGASPRLQYSTKNTVNADDEPIAETSGGRVDLVIGDDDVTTGEAPVKVPLSASHFTKVDDGWRISYSVGASGLKPFIGGADVGKIPWHFEAVDRAGNMARSDGSVKDTTTEAGLDAGTTAVSADFAGGGYTDDTFIDRSVKITASATTAAQGGIFNAPDPVTACAEGVALSGGNPAFTPDSGAMWSVKAISQTRTVSDFVASTGTFTWTDPVMTTATLHGLIDHDSDGGTTDAVPCTVTSASTAIAVRAGATVEVLNTRTIILDDVDPVLVARETGTAWNGAANRGSRLQTGTKAKRNSLMVSFRDQSGLDANTVNPASFAVASNTVTSVLMVDSSKESGADNLDDAILVFLTLETPLESSEKPMVSIPVAVIKDNAGNAVSNQATPTRATDKLGPGLTLTESDDLSNSSVTITIVSDEDLGAPPSLWNALVEETGEDTGIFRAERDANSLRSTSASGSLQRFTYKHTASPGSSGEYNVYVEGMDTAGAGNPGKVGHTNDPAHSSAFTYELDTRLNGGVQPKVSIGEDEVVGSQKGGDNAVTTADEIEAVDPMIVTVDFAAEGSEYDRDSYRTVMLSSASLKVTAADGSTLQSRDFNLTTDISSQDQVKFTIPLLTPRNGNYQLTLTAADEAGNNNLNNTSASSAEKLVFSWEVVAPKPVTIPLDPGWNLISLPFQPGNPAINSVIPVTHPADIVMTFDNVNQLWLVTRRDAESGRFIGDIPVLSANTAYFIHTSNFENLKVLRPPLTTAAAAPPPPPAIEVVKGWNLVPVVSNEIPTPKSIDADDYFGTLKSGAGAGWLKALTFNTLVRTWTSVEPNETENLDGTATYDHDNDPETNQILTPETPVQVVVGKGYWLYSTVDGVIIP